MLNITTLKKLIENSKDAKTTLLGILLILLTVALYLHLINGTEYASIISGFAGIGLIFGTGAKE